MPQSQFERTRCDCPECSQHCTQVPGMLAGTDVFLLVDGDPTNFRASMGALVCGEQGVFRIPTIVPAMKNGRCVFLMENGHCSIHENSPFGCAYLDSHMSAAEGDLRVRAALVSLVKDYTASGPLASWWTKLVKEFGAIENRRIKQE